MVDDTPHLPRPTLVTILAVLTLLGTGFYFGYILLERMVPELELQSVDVPTWITVTVGVAQVGKSVAAVLLLGMRRIGFYLYAVLEVIGAIATIFSGKFSIDYMESSYVNPDIAFDPRIFVLLLMGMSIGLSILFIWGFAAHLSKMR